MSGLIPDCSHLDAITVTELPASVDGSEDCLREGGEWLQLRICLQCGHVGCCDDSPGQHASRHGGGSGMCSSAPSSRVSNGAGALSTRWR